MHGEELLVLGVLFLIAYVLGRLGKFIGLPAIPIYMLVGLLASPNFALFPLDFSADDVELVAIFGLIFLLFSLGLFVATGQIDDASAAMASEHLRRHRPALVELLARQAGGLAHHPADGVVQRVGREPVEVAGRKSFVRREHGRPGA